MLAARLTPAEMAEQEQYELAMEQARRRNSRKKFLPEEDPKDFYLKDLTRISKDCEIIYTEEPEVKESFKSFFYK